MRGHFKTVHPDYWKWLRKWIAINTLVAFTAMISIFPLLIYNIILSRTATAYTFVGIGIWMAVTFSAFGTGAFINTEVVGNSGKNRLRSIRYTSVRTATFAE